MKIIVVGGGIMGLACAWRLASAGALVELYEARACGRGATCASLGALWPASPLAEGPLQRFHRSSLWEFESFLGQLSEQTGLEVRFRRGGRLELLNSARAEARAAQEAAWANEHWPGFAAPLPTMELLTPDEMVGRFPGLGRPGHAGLLCRATAHVHVFDLVGALLAACRGAGVEIREGVQVTGVEGSGSRVEGVMAGGRLRTADAYLVAGGAESSRLPVPGRAIDEVAPVVPVLGQGIALRRPARFEFEGIFKAGTVYIVPWEDELLVGATTESDGTHDPRLDPAGPALLARGAAELFGCLKEAPVLRHWHGPRPQNPRKGHLPFMGPHPDLANLWFCTAHYKTGIGMSARASALVARSILSGEIAPELRPFVPSREGGGQGYADSANC